MKRCEMSNNDFLSLIIVNGYKQAIESKNFSKFFDLKASGIYRHRRLFSTESGPAVDVLKCVGQKKR